MRTKVQQAIIKVCEELELLGFFISVKTKVTYRLVLSLVLLLVGWTLIVAFLTEKLETSSMGRARTPIEVSLQKKRSID